MSDGNHALCRFEDLADPGSLAVSIGTGNWPLRAFVVRRGAQAFAYVNRCPHAGHPLDWLPNRFLNADESLIQCASHGALFTLEAGHCVVGPCAGKHLISIEVHIVAGNVMLKDDPEALAQRFA
jgi:nitrite reductase/ring-hydroxylating ferredoxin subunit